jgi:hypothetical protein
MELSAATFGRQSCHLKINWKSKGLTCVRDRCNSAAKRALSKMRSGLTNDLKMSGEQPSESLRRCRSDTHEVAPLKTLCTRFGTPGAQLGEPITRHRTFFIICLSRCVNNICGKYRLNRLRQLFQLGRPGTSRQCHARRIKRRGEVPSSSQLVSPRHEPPLSPKRRLHLKPNTAFQAVKRGSQNKQNPCLRVHFKQQTRTQIVCYRADSGSQSSPRSRHFAECVNAPELMRSPPVSAMPRTVSSVTPPDASN